MMATDFAATARNYLQWYDYVVFCAVLLISGSIGVYFAFKARRGTSADEYLLASKQMTVLPVSLSLLASFISAISLLGIPSDIYLHGTQYVWVALAYVFVIAISNEVFLPVYVKLKLNTSYQYLKLRFCKAVQVAACIAFSAQMILYMGIVIYAPSLALSQVTGFDVWIAVASIGLVATFYTSIGGMKAVVWTDVFQVSMMTIGFLITLVKCTIDAGGVAKVWRIADEGGRIEFFNISPDPTIRHTIWSQLIGQMFVWLSVYAINQTMVQRCLSLGSLREMKKAYWINAICLILVVLICSACGIVAYATYAGCDPKLSGDITAYDQLMPLMVMYRMHSIPLLPGIFVASIFSGALSTVSSGVNSLASVTINDILDRVVVNFTEKRKTLLCKALAATYGFLSLGFAVLASQLGSVLQAALGIFGMVGGPVLGIFTLGMFFRMANSKGALAGHVISQIFVFWIGLGYYVVGVKSPSLELTDSFCPSATAGPMENTTSSSSATFDAADAATTSAAVDDQSEILSIYKMSYAWYAMIGWAVALLIGLLVSAVTRDREAEAKISLDHFTPIVHRFMQPTSADCQHSSKLSINEKHQSVSTEMHFEFSHVPPTEMDSHQSYNVTTKL